MTPYTTRTGLRIGLRYTPKPHHDRDALRLQSALLGNRDAIDWEGIYIVAVVVAAVVGLIVWGQA